MDRDLIQCGACLLRTTAATFAAVEACRDTLFGLYSGSTDL